MLTYHAVVFKLGCMAVRRTLLPSPQVCSVWLLRQPAVLIDGI